MAVNLLRTFAGARTVTVFAPILAAAHRDDAPSTVRA
jgi:hypothetical protein